MFARDEVSDQEMNYELFVFFYQICKQKIIDILNTVSQRINLKLPFRTFKLPWFVDVVATIKSL